MIQLSGVVIAFNEEEKIGQCLDSLLRVCDDVVVVDSFSADRTKEIVLSKGVRFIQHPFEGHIQQKNFALTQALFPYVLSLDADEVLSEQLIHSILGVKSNWLADGYEMNRLNNYCGEWIRHGGWYPDRKLRLLDSRKGSWGGENPHDKLIMVPGSKMIKLNGDILHYTIKSVEDHEKQIEKFTDIAAQQIKRKGELLPVPFIYIKAAVKFLKDYFLKLGFLDFRYGYTIARLNAKYVYLKYKKAAGSA